MSGPARLRAIFFDAGNTLIRINYEVIAEVLGTHGVRVTPEALRRADWPARVRLDADLGAVTTSTESESTGLRYLRYVLDGVGVTDEATVSTIAEWRRTYNQPVGVWNVADPDAIAALRLVREAGVRAAVISNSNGSVRSILESLGMTPWLEFVIDSSEVGFEKPDPRIFHAALERMDVRAADALYIGDLYSVDVIGARGAGLRAMLLDPAGCWGRRDCAMAPTVLAAVRLALNGAAA